MNRMRRSCSKGVLAATSGRQALASRRIFLASAVRSGLASLSLVGAGCSGPSPDRRAVTSHDVKPSNRIALGFIGTGSHGVAVNLRTFLAQPDAQVVALCDVDERRLADAAEIVKQHDAANTVSGASKGCHTTGDWREIIAREDIDAVVISTPDHWHAIPAVAALKSGKDVLCEKPLALTVQEGRAISNAATRYQRVFQVGTPNRSRTAFLKACEIVRNGRLGKLQTIRVCLWRGHGENQTDLKPDAAPVPAPKWFNYDMWLGQAPEAPYTPARCHFNFRYILDYSGGNLTDFGAHFLDVAQWGNDTENTGPISVEGHGRFPEDGLYNVATDWEITYQYANGVTLLCQSGGYYVRFEGEGGWVQADNAHIETSSPGLLAPTRPNELHLRTCPQGEQRDFLDCVKSRSATYAPAETGHRSITLAHLGNISMRLGRKLAWNPDLEVFTNDEEANRMLFRPMRSPWHL